MYSNSTGIPVAPGWGWVAGWLGCSAAALWLRLSAAKAMLLLGLLVCCAGVVTGSAPVPSWHNASLDTSTRTEALIKSLTLNEKVSLLQVKQPAIGRIGLPSYNFGRECEPSWIRGSHFA